MKCFAALMVALFALISPSAAIEDECKACRAIGVSACIYTPAPSRFPLEDRRGRRKRNTTQHFGFFRKRDEAGEGGCCLDLLRVVDGNREMDEKKTQRVVSSWAASERHSAFRRASPTQKQLRI